VNGSDLISSNAGCFVENFAAELTEAAYSVMCQHGMVDDWLDLELALWSVLKETVKKWDREWPRAGVVVCGPLPGYQESQHIVEFARDRQQ